MQRGKSQTLSNVLAHLLMFYLHAEKKKHPYIHCTVKEENEKKNPNIMMIAYEKCIKLWVCVCVRRGMYVRESKKKIKNHVKAARERGEWLID